MLKSARAMPSNTTPSTNPQSNQNTSILQKLLMECNYSELGRYNGFNFLSNEEVTVDKILNIEDVINDRIHETSGLPQETIKAFRTMIKYMMFFFHHYSFNKELFEDHQEYKLKALTFVRHTFSLIPEFIIISSYTQADIHKNQVVVTMPQPLVLNLLVGSIAKNIYLKIPTVGDTPIPDALAMVSAKAISVKAIKNSLNNQRQQLESLKAQDQFSNKSEEPEIPVKDRITSFRYLITTEPGGKQEVIQDDQHNTTLKWHKTTPGRTSIDNPDLETIAVCGSEDCTGFFNKPYGVETDTSLYGTLDRLHDQYFKNILSFSIGMSSSFIFNSILHPAAQTIISELSYQLASKKITIPQVSLFFLLKTLNPDNQSILRLLFVKHARWSVQTQAAFNPLQLFKVRLTIDICKIQTFPNLYVTDKISILPKPNEILEESQDSQTNISTRSALVTAAMSDAATDRLKAFQNGEAKTYKSVLSNNTDYQEHHKIQLDFLNNIMSISEEFISSITNLRRPPSQYTVNTENLREKINTAANKINQLPVATTIIADLNHMLTDFSKSITHTSQGHSIVSQCATNQLNKLMYFAVLQANYFRLKLAESIIGDN